MSNTLATPTTPSTPSATSRTPGTEPSPRRAHASWAHTMRLFRRFVRTRTSLLSSIFTPMLMIVFQWALFGDLIAKVQGLEKVDLLPLCLMLILGSQWLYIPANSAEIVRERQSGIRRASIHQRQRDPATDRWRVALQLPAHHPRQYPRPHRLLRVRNAAPHLVGGALAARRRDRRGNLHRHAGPRARVRSHQPRRHHDRHTPVHGRAVSLGGVCPRDRVRLGPSMVRAKQPCDPRHRGRNSA